MNRRILINRCHHVGVASFLVGLARLVHIASLFFNFFIVSNCTLRIGVSGRLLWTFVHVDDLLYYRRHLAAHVLLRLANRVSNRLCWGVRNGAPWDCSVLVVSPFVVRLQTSLVHAITCQPVESRSPYAHAALFSNEHTSGCPSPYPSDDTH